VKLTIYYKCTHSQYMIDKSAEIFDGQYGSALYYVRDMSQLCTVPVIVKGKGKAVPLQAWTGPEGSRKLRFPDFVTTAQDDGKVVRLTHRPPLPPKNTLGTHFHQRLS